MKFNMSLILIALVSLNAQASDLFKWPAPIQTIIRVANNVNGWTDSHDLNQFVKEIKAGKNEARGEVCLYMGMINANLDVLSNMIDGIDDSLLFSFPKKDKLLGLRDEIGALDSETLYTDACRAAINYDGKNAEATKGVKKMLEGAKKINEKSQELSDVLEELKVHAGQ